MADPTRSPLIAGNWKMNLLTGAGAELVKTLAEKNGDAQGVEIVVCPPFTALPAVACAAHGSNIALGGQNCYHEESGAFTGEVSPQMLRDVGCEWCIIGHSERRHIFGEDDAFLNKKLHYAIENGLKVMFCIGETLDEREANKMETVLERQVTEGLKGLPEYAFENLAVAYEPVWAIGTGKTATPDQAEEAHRFVREQINKQFGESIANKLRIQYGGSVKPDNAAELIGQPNVDGFLVGGASLKADSFAAIIDAAAK